MPGSKAVGAVFGRAKACDGRSVGRPARNRPRIRRDRPADASPDANKNLAGIRPALGGFVSSNRRGLRLKRNARQPSGRRSKRRSVGQETDEDSSVDTRSVVATDRPTDRPTGRLSVLGKKKFTRRSAEDRVVCWAAAPDEL